MEFNYVEIKEKLIKRLEREVLELRKLFDESEQARDYGECVNLADETKRRERLIEVQKKKLKELKEGK